MASFNLVVQSKGLDVSCEEYAPESSWYDCYAYVELRMAQVNMSLMFHFGAIHPRYTLGYFP